LEGLLKIVILRCVLVFGKSCCYGLWTREWGVEYHAFGGGKIKAKKQSSARAGEIISSLGMIGFWKKGRRKWKVDLHERGELKCWPLPGLAGSFWSGLN
jgi:hypothetical protein